MTTSIMNFIPRMTRIAIALSAMLMLTNAAFAQKDLPINPAVKDALYLIDREQPTKAIAELEKIVAGLPTDASLLYYLGYAQIKTGDRTKAAASFDKGIQVNPNEALNYVGKGYINMLDKKPAEAKAQFDKALSMTKSKSVAVLKGVAEAYNIDNKYSVESVALLNKAKSITDADAEIYLLLGDTYLNQNVGGNVGPTVSAYESALTAKVLDSKQKAHSDAKAHYKTGMVYEKAKNNGVALESFEASVKADAEYTSAYRELGQLYYLNKEYPKAVAAYEKYLAMTEKPETPQYQYEYAFFLFANKEYAKANAVFAKVAYQPDAKPTTLKFASKSLYESGDLQKSRELFEKYMGQVKPEELDANDYLYYGKTLLAIPNDDKSAKAKTDSLGLVYLLKSYDMNKSQGDLILQIGNAYYKMKKYPQAISAYQELMRARKTPSAQDYFMIGQAFYYNDQLDAADTTFKKFQVMKPELINGYSWDANVQAKKEEVNKTEGSAKAAFEKLLEKASVDPVKNKKELVQAYQYLGYYYYANKNATKAREMYKKWVEIDPGNAAATDALNTLDKAIKAAQTPAKPKSANK